MASIHLQAQLIQYICHKGINMLLKNKLPFNFNVFIFNLDYVVMSCMWTIFGFIKLTRQMVNFNNISE